MTHRLKPSSEDAVHHVITVGEQVLVYITIKQKLKMEF
jgi:hypothetical protein